MGTAISPYLHRAWADFLKWITLLPEKLYAKPIFISPYNLAATFNISIQIGQCDCNC